MLRGRNRAERLPCFHPARSQPGREKGISSEMIVDDHPMIILITLVMMMKIITIITIPTKMMMRMNWELHPHLCGGSVVTSATGREDCLQSAAFLRIPSKSHARIDFHRAAWQKSVKCVIRIIEGCKMEI